jgi:hypothetical protein
MIVGRLAMPCLGDPGSSIVQLILNTVELPDPIDVTNGITLYRNKGVRNLSCF